MIFANLNFERIIIHEIFTRDENRDIIPPRYGQKLVELAPKARAELKNRVVTALGKASQSVEMEIQKAGPGSMFALARELIAASDQEFIERSRSAADLLASAQLARSIPGGILVVFSGEVDHPPKRLIGVIKAEPQNGFTRTQRDGVLDLQYIEDLILTPQAKLYKIGVFVEVDRAAAQSAKSCDGFKAFIYDDSMTASNRDAAAQYFYDGFFGCRFPQSSARLTKEFHDLTKEFIRQLSIAEEDKSDLYTSLFTYLKVDQAPTVEVATFAQSYLPNDHMRDTYEAFMTSRNFPANAVQKDLVEVAPHLRQRKIGFRSGIRLTAPADKFDLIHIKAVDGAEANGGAADEWTHITVRDRIAFQ